MKRILFTIAALLFAAGISSAQKTAFTLNVELNSIAPGSRAILVYNKSSQADSLLINGNAFEMKGMIDRPQSAYLIIRRPGEKQTRSNTFRLYLEQGTISITSKDSLQSAEVHGGEINNEYNNYKDFLSSAQQAMNALSAIWKAASPEQQKSPDFINDYNIKRDAAQELYAKRQLEFVKTYPNSFFSLETLEVIFGGFNMMDPVRAETLFATLSGDLQNSPKGKDFQKLFLDSKKTMLGVSAPQFSHRDTSGNLVSLSKFKGRYVLVDFWASWCVPCRAENPNVVKAFNKFKERNFTIVGVSLDRPAYRRKWLEAIKTDNLPWTQLNDDLSEKNGASALYGVSSIPSNFLLDPQGKIIVKNLRGTALEEKLEALLK